MRTVIKLSLRNLLSNRLRFALTTFAILLGVSFVVASFVLTDGLLAWRLGATFLHLTVDEATEDAHQARLRRWGRIARPFLFRSPAE